VSRDGITATNGVVIKKPLFYDRGMVSKTSPIIRDEGF